MDAQGCDVRTTEGAGWGVHGNTHALGSPSWSIELRLKTGPIMPLSLWGT